MATEPQMTINKAEAIYLASALNNEIRSMKSHKDAKPDLQRKSLEPRIALFNKMVKEAGMEEIFHYQEVEAVSPTQQEPPKRLLHNIGHPWDHITGD